MAAALLSAMIVGLLFFPSGVSAQVIELTVYDQIGDLGCSFDVHTGEASTMWSENTPWVKPGYFDMKSFWLIQDGTAFTFGMELVANLPNEGDSLPAGIGAGEWAMWVNPDAWNPALNPVVSLYMIAVTYDESRYDAYVMDYATKEKTPIQFEIIGSVIKLRFSVDMIGDRYSFYWEASTRIYFGTKGLETYGFWFTDMPDWGAVPYQEWYDIPWPYPPV